MDTNSAKSIARLQEHLDDARMRYSQAADSIGRYQQHYEEICAALSGGCRFYEIVSRIEQLKRELEAAKGQLDSCRADNVDVQDRLCAEQAAHRKTDERPDGEPRFFDTVPNRGGKTMQEEPMINEIKHLKAKIDEARATVRSLIAERDAALAEVARLKEANETPVEPGAPEPGVRWGMENPTRSCRPATKMLTKVYKSPLVGFATADHLVRTLKHNFAQRIQPHNPSSEWSSSPATIEMDAINRDCIRVHVLVEYGEDEVWQDRLVRGCFEMAAVKVIT